MALLTDCNDNQQVHKIKLSEQATIVAFGNSLTEGVGASFGNDYPSILAEQLGRTVINAGIAGEDSYQALGRIERVLERYQPDVVILLHGGNDILRGYDLTKTQENLRQIIEKIQKNNSKIILVGVPMANIFLTTAPFYHRLAKKYHLIYNKTLLSGLFSDSRYKSDAIHLNDKGYQKLAKVLASYFEVIQ